MMARADPLPLFFAISLTLHAILFWTILGPVLGSLEVLSLRPVIEIVELPRVARAPRTAETAPPTPVQPPAPETPEAEAPPALPPPAAEPFRDMVEIPKPAVEQTPRDARTSGSSGRRGRAIFRSTTGETSPIAGQPIPWRPPPRHRPNGARPRRGQSNRRRRRRRARSPAEAPGRAPPRSRARPERRSGRGR
jgi:hypothetical protein